MKLVRTDIVPARSGEHYLEVSSDNLFVDAPDYNGVGKEDRYTVLVRVRDDYTGLTDTRGVVGNVFAPSTGVLERSTDHDFFRMGMRGGETYAFTLLGADAAATDGLGLQVDDADGNTVELLARHSDGRFRFTPPTPDGRFDTWYLGVYSQGTTGPYRLSSDGGDIPDGVETSALLGPPDYTTGFLHHLRDADWYRITLEAGETYEIAMRAELRDEWVPSVDVRLHDLNGDVLVGSNRVADDPAAERIEARTTFTAPYGGRYFLSAREVPQDRRTRGGLYELRFAESSGAGDDDFAADDGTAGYIETRLLQPGRLEAAGDRDWFRLTLTGGERHRIRLTGRGDETPLDDPVLRLLDENVALLLESEQRAADGSLVLDIGPEHAGRHFVEVASRSDQAGSYVLRHLAGDVPDSIYTWQRLGTAGETRSSLYHPEDEDRFRFALDGESDYEFTLEPDRAAGRPAEFARLRLLDEHGIGVEPAPASTDNRLLISAGSLPEQTVYLQVERGDGRSEGDYVLRARTPAAQACEP